jgi:glycosyltransferase involved in cell wall biosynthesis
MTQQPQRTAIVHEWFTSMRGGEKCVEALCELFPRATVFTLMHVKGSVSPTIEQMPIQTSFIQKLPFAANRYRYYLPLFPGAVQRFDLEKFDLVVSSNHCVAKGVRVPEHALHVCYCHSPMRYIWDLYDDYFGKDRAGVLTRIGMRAALPYLRRWDLRTASNPHYFIANSANVQRRIKDIYNRSSDIIYPPVNTSLFQLSGRNDGYFLVVSAFVPYKRIDLAIRAFNSTGDRLVIVGDGPDAGRLQEMAGPTIDFVGWQPDERLKDFYAGCRAVVFPGEEDFGIVPVEAMASGKPVIAYAKGGALETVVDTAGLKTGVLFREQTVESLVEAIRRCKEAVFTPDILRSHALSFDREIYKQKMKEYIAKKWAAFSADSRKSAQ